MSILRLVESEPGQSRYAALAAALRERIVAGEWPAGSALPAEQMLASDHGVALGTLRRALELLAEQGLIERIHGRGTFVKQGLGGATMLRFFRFGGAGGMAAVGGSGATGGAPAAATTSDTPASRILAREARPAPAEVARALGCGPGEQALRVKRLRSVAGEPALYELIWLPLPLFAPLAHSDPASWGSLFYPFFAERCGVFVHRAVDSISFGNLGAAPARALLLPAGHPCACVQRQAFDLSGRCVEWRRTVGDAHAFHYTVTIT